MKVPIPGPNKVPIAPPNQVPRPVPIPLNAALPIGSPDIQDKTNSIMPPISGTLFTIGLRIFAAAFTPPLPRPFTSAALPRLVILERPYLPPKLLNPSAPNLLSAASLPYLEAYLLARSEDIPFLNLPVCPWTPLILSNPRRAPSFSACFLTPSATLIATMAPIKVPFNNLFTSPAKLSNCLAPSSPNTFST